MEKMRRELVSIDWTEDNKPSDNSTCDQDKDTAYKIMLMRIFSFPFFLVLPVSLKVVVFPCNEIG